MQWQYLNQYIKFIYIENVIRLVLFIVLLLPPKILFDQWFFYFSFHGDQQRNNIYLQCWVCMHTKDITIKLWELHKNRKNELKVTFPVIELDTSKILGTLSYELVKSLFLWIFSDKLSSYNFSISEIAAYDD